MDANNKLRNQIHTSLLNSHTSYAFIDTQISPRIKKLFPFSDTGKSKAKNHLWILRNKKPIEASKDSDRKANYKKFMRMFLESKFGDDLFFTLARQKEKKQQYYFWNDTIKYSLPFDLLKTAPIVPNIFTPSYIPDSTTYKHIFSKSRYKNMSNLQILKLLFSQHKLHRDQFRESKRRLKNGERLRANVQEKIQVYLSTFKASTSKNTLSSLKKQLGINIFCPVWLGNQKFQIKLKKSIFKRGYSINAIQEETVRKMKNCNLLGDF